MGWQISRNGDLYRIWSTISDTFLTDWISRSEALAVYYEDALLSFKKKIIEQYLQFPNYWTDHDNHRPGAVIIDHERHDAYIRWLHDLSEKRDDEEYCQFIDEMFKKIKAEIEEQKKHE